MIDAMVENFWSKSVPNGLICGMGEGGRSKVKSLKLCSYPTI